MASRYVVDLTLAELDFWVREAEKARGADMQGSPTTDWAIGGPIISRLGPAFSRVNDNGRDCFCCSIYEDHRMVASAIGDTHLIATMRAYVTLVFGGQNRKFGSR